MFNGQRLCSPTRPLFINGGILSLLILFGHEDLSDPLEQIFNVMLDVELSEKIQIFFLKRLLAMMLFLIQNIVIAILNL